MTAGGRAVGAMVVAALLWGATFVAVRDTVDAITPTALVAARFAAAAILWAIALIIRALLREAPTRAAARAAWSAGILGGPFAAAAFWCQAIGLQQTTAGSSAFLTSTGSLCAAPLAWLLLRQRPTGRLAWGLLLALAGSALLGIRGGSGLGIGEAWTLLGAIAYSVQIVIVARWAAQADPYLLTAVQAACTAALFLPWVRDLGGQLASLQGGLVIGFGYLVVAGSMVAPLLQILAQRVLPPARIGLLLALEPVFALGFALSWGQERFVGRWWVGAGLILAAVIMVEGRAEQRPSSRPATG